MSIDKDKIDLAVLKHDIEYIKNSQTKIMKLIQGNGESGIITQIALFKQSLNKAWWWLGGVSMVMLAKTVYILLMHK